MGQQKIQDKTKGMNDLFEEEAVKSQKKKEKKKTRKPKKMKKGPLPMIKRGRAYIQATYNNIIITITDLRGDTLAWSSSGLMGFKGPKKSTPFAAGVTVKDLVGRTKERGLQEVDVLVKGVGPGREAAIRALNANNIQIISIKDVTSIPHNGCRPPKLRRI